MRGNDARQVRVFLGNTIVWLGRLGKVRPALQCHASVPTVSGQKLRGRQAREEKGRDKERTRKEQPCLFACESQGT